MTEIRRFSCNLCSRAIEVGVDGNLLDGYQLVDDSHSLRLDRSADGKTHVCRRCWNMIQQSTSNCHISSYDDSTAVDKEWLSSVMPLRNDLVEIRVTAVIRKFDCIELLPINEDQPSKHALLAMNRYPISRGDVRRLCHALGIKIGR